jgi:3-dehydroquinate synthase class II
MNNWNEASETFLSHSAEVIDKYKEDIDKINDMAGISTTKFENHIDNVVVNINDMSDDTLTSVNDLSETMRNEFSSALSEAVNWELQYVDAMDTMINRNETFVKSLNLMIEKLAGVNTSITEMLTPLETLDNIINQSTTPVYY